jgi:hypothetical protein
MGIFLGILKSILDFILSYWKQIAIAVLIGFLIYFIYNKGYQEGYVNRTQFYEKINAENHKNLIKKIDSLESTANTLVDTANKNQQALGKDLTTILVTVKNKKLTVVNKDGECIPSKDFIETYNNITIRGNK